VNLGYSPKHEVAGRIGLWIDGNIENRVLSARKYVAVDASSHHPDGSLYTRVNHADPAIARRTVVAGSRFMATRTDGRRTEARGYGHFNGFAVWAESGALINKAWKTMAAV
jgi:hypothetical protein